MDGINVVLALAGQEEMCVADGSDKHPSPEIQFDLGCKFFFPTPTKATEGSRFKIFIR